MSAQKKNQPIINQRRVLQYFLKYVKISSPSHQEAAIRTALRSHLIQLKAKTKIDGTGNLIAHVPGVGALASAVPLLLSAHMDTVKP